MTQENEKENSVPSKKVCTANIALRNSLVLTNVGGGGLQLEGKYVESCQTNNENVNEDNDKHDKNNYHDEYKLINFRKRKLPTSDLSESFKKGTEIWPSYLPNYDSLG